MADSVNIIAARFWSKVDVGHPNDCWEWRARRTPKGYGLFGDSRRAHRVSYEREYGPIPAGKIVMHKCDNPSCVNPRHLKVGTVMDNNRDCIKKGRKRVAFGLRNGRGKIADQTIAAIRASSDTGSNLAKQYGISGAMVSYIRNHKRRA